jgi:hypothetical protein
MPVERLNCSLRASPYSYGREEEKTVVDRGPEKIGTVDGMERLLLVLTF